MNSSLPDRSIKILIADDHALFRDSIISYIERLVPKAQIKALGNLEEVRKDLASDSSYDLVFIDWHMPGVKDVGDLMDLILQHPKLYFVLMSGVVRPHQVQKIIMAGFRAYLPKTLSGPEMLAAMERILRGESFVPLDPATAEPESSYRADRAVTLPATHGKDQVTLTEREHEAVSFLIEGLTNEEIADRMGISIATVKMHLRNSFDKLQVRNRTEAAMRYRELGLIDD